MKTLTQLLLFKLSKAQMLALNSRHFLLGLFITWLVGMGRYWDDDRAKLLQKLGLGSVFYIFCLAALIFIVVYPFKVQGWSYFRVLTFISLTSLPALFYAIPVEQFMSIQAANKANAWFLGLVALWRLCLLFWFLRVFTGLHPAYITATALLPVCLIITALTFLNLHHVVYNIMGGFRQPSAHDTSYGVLMVLTGGSMLLVVPLLIVYLAGIWSSYTTRKSNQQPQSDSP